MKFTANNSKKEGLLTIDGALTIHRSSELKDVLLQAMTEVDSIKIQVDQVTDIDLSCLQLLCAAHKTSMKIQKRLQIEGNRTDLLQKAFKDAGFPQFMKCKNTDDSGHCIWLSGGSHE